MFQDGYLVTIFHVLNGFELLYFENQSAKDIWCLQITPAINESLSSLKIPQSIDHEFIDSAKVDFSYLHVDSK